MAMQQRKRRRRSGGNNNNNSNNPNKHFESNGPDVRIRGSAAQILEKYMQYASDAQTSGDRIKAEALYQHAEHYARIVAVVAKEQEKVRLEREARDAAKAEERAARDAEERAERMAKAEERATAAAADDTGTTENAEAEAPAQSDAPKPRRRPRKDAAASEAKADADASTEADTEAPKRRRRTYKPKDDAVEEGGVMKTLSRGVEPAPADGE